MKDKGAGCEDAPYQIVDSPADFSASSEEEKKIEELISAASACLGEISFWGGQAQEAADMRDSWESKLRDRLDRVRKERSRLGVLMSEIKGGLSG